MSRLLCVTFVIVSRISVVCRGDDAAPSDAPSAVKVNAADVKGRPQQELVKVTNARYFVWFDGRGWHLRTASKNLIKFSGSVKLEQGSFIKLRPIGLDTRDRWGVNEDRTEIRFELRTGGSFDGFDFDVKRTGAAPRITFDLKIGREDKGYPKRIFLGRDSKNPKGVRFECPADPAALKRAEEETNEPPSPEGYRLRGPLGIKPASSG